MFNTKNLVIEGSDVPSYWVFQYYLNLSEPLTGQDVKIKSVFNPSERTPSFCVYVDKSIMQYKFKDFSTGKNGNKVDLVKLMFNLEYPDAMKKIVEDYNIHVKSGDYKNQQFVPQAKWEIDIIKIRDWNTDDQKFWLPYNIGKSLLNHYNVKPVKYYNLVKEENGEIKKLTIQNKICYGYFDKDDEVYKLYQPHSQRHKFFKVKPYLQAYDQLEYKHPYLIICSSLKDALCMKSIVNNVEVLAPDSENTMIKPHIIEHFKKKYKKVITFFDNDDAGIKAVHKYKTMYNLDGVIFPECKDISDAMKEKGLKYVASILKPLLKDIISK